MNKTVLITGSVSGIGAGLAEAFAQAGYNVAVNGRSDKDLTGRGATVVEACQSFGVNAKCFIADVAKFEDCARLTKEVTEEFGGIDVLINNAGITKDGLIVRMKEEDFLEVIQVNLNSVFNMCRNVTPLMMKKRSGCIINMSSVAGVFGNGGQTNYSASKAGILGFTKSLAKELGSRGIICNAIAPGFVQSPMTDKLSDDIKEKILSGITLKRFGNTKDIAEVALFLASTTYMTGQTLVVDGGLIM